MHSCACNFHFHTSPRRSTTTAQFVDVSLNRLLPRLRGAAELADSGRKTAHQEHDQTSSEAEERLDEEPEIFCRADPEGYRNRVDEPEAEEQEVDEEEEEEEEDHREELEEEVEPEEEQRERRQTHEASRTIRSSASSAV